MSEDFQNRMVETIMMLVHSQCHLNKLSFSLENSIQFSKVKHFPSIYIICLLRYAEQSGFFLNKSKYFKVCMVFVL